MTTAPLKVCVCTRWIADTQKVVVTGGLGYIGSHVVIALLLTGKYIPIVLDNCHNAYPEAVQRCGEIAKKELG